MTENTEGARERRGARSEYPEDRFDRLERSGRVGAHRINARPRYVWQYLVAGVIGFVLLSGVGILLVSSIGGTSRVAGISISSSSGGKSSNTVDAELDPDATVAVLNGTETANLAAGVDQVITEEEWGTILFSGSAESTDVTISAVFYSDEADAAAAAGLAAELGGLSTYTTEDYAEYGAQLVVLLGSDYAGPGFDEAQVITDNEEAGDATTGGIGADETDSDGAQVDPATGWEIDPETGWPIDPATGLATDPSTL